MLCSISHERRQNINKRSIVNLSKTVYSFLWRGLPVFSCWEMIYIFLTCFSYTLVATYIFQFLTYCHCIKVEKFEFISIDRLYISQCSQIIHNKISKNYKICSKLFYDRYIFVLDLVATDACSSFYRKWEFLDAIWITKLVKSINIWETPLFSTLWCISMIMKIFCKSYQTKEIVIVT